MKIICRMLKIVVDKEIECAYKGLASLETRRTCGMDEGAQRINEDEEMIYIHTRDADFIANSETISKLLECKQYLPKLSDHFISVMAAHEIDAYNYGIDKDFEAMPDEKQAYYILQWLINHRPKIAIEIGVL